MRFRKEIRRFKQKIGRISEERKGTMSKVILVKDHNLRLSNFTLINDKGESLFVKSLLQFSKDKNLNYPKFSRELKLYKKSLGYKINE